MITFVQKIPLLFKSLEKFPLVNIGRLYVSSTAFVLFSDREMF